MEAESLYGLLKVVSLKDRLKKQRHGLFVPMAVADLGFPVGGRELRREGRELPR